MVNDGEIMKALTDYVSEFSLTALVHAHASSDKTVELAPLWIGGGRVHGMALFVSALDAEIFRHSLIAARGNNGWRRLPLANFDLLKHIKESGGYLICNVIFGFTATQDGKLATRSGTIPYRFIPTDFRVTPNTDHTTFLFPEWLFKFIQAEWAKIGAESHTAELDALNTANDSVIMENAVLALDRATPVESKGPESHWGVYSQAGGGWHFGPRESGQVRGAANEPAQLEPSPGA